MFAIASRRARSLRSAFSRTWISAPWAPGKIDAKRAFGVPAGRRASNTSRETNCGSSRLGAEVSP